MAVPNPERELARLQKTLKQGLPACVVISGVSEFFRCEAFDAAFDAVPSDADLRSLDGGNETDGREINDLRGGNLFGNCCVLAVRRGDDWLKMHGDALLTTLPAIPKGSAILLEIKKLDRRTKIAKALGKVGELFEFRDLYGEPYDRSRSPLDAEMVGWIESRSRSMGCPLTAESAFLVMSSVGKKPGEILQELRRLASAAGQTERALTPDDLRGKLTCSFESTPFEFADCLLAFDRARSTRALTAMYQHGSVGKDGKRVEQGGLFPFITSWLYQALARLLEGRALVDSGVSIGDVPGRLGVRQFTDRFEEQLRRNPTARLRRGMKLLHDCQRELRTTGEDPHYLLLRFLGRYFREEEAVA